MGSESTVLPGLGQTLGGPGTLSLGFCTGSALVFNFFPLFFLPPCYLNGFKHETRPGKGGSIVLIISNYDRCNINCIFP